MLFFCQPLIGSTIHSLLVFGLVPVLTEVLSLVESLLYARHPAYTAGGWASLASAPSRPRKARAGSWCHFFLFIRWHNIIAIIRLHKILTRIAWIQFRRKRLAVCVS